MPHEPHIVVPLMPWAPPYNAFHPLNHPNVTHNNDATPQWCIPCTTMPWSNTLKQRNESVISSDKHFPVFWCISTGIETVQCTIVVMDAFQCLFYEPFEKLCSKTLLWIKISQNCILNTFEEHGCIPWKRLYASIVESLKDWNDCHIWRLKDLMTSRALMITSMIVIFNGWRAQHVPWLKGEMRSVVEGRLVFNDRRAHLFHNINLFWSLEHESFSIFEMFVRLECVQVVSMKLMRLSLQCVHGVYNMQ